MVHLFLTLAGLILVTHLLFNAWVVLGAAVTNGRAVLERLHILSLFYGAVMENVSLACPLTVAQKWAMVRAGEAPYHGAFVLHYLQVLVAPNFPLVLLHWGAIGVLIVNLGIYGRRYARRYAEAQGHVVHH